jgi:arylsulfatase A-like enzyme
MNLSPVDASVIHALLHGLWTSALVGSSFSLALLIKSLFVFTRTGPHMSGRVLSDYRLYLVYSLARLAFYASLIGTFMAFPWVAAYVIGVVPFGIPYHSLTAAGVGLTGIVILTARQFLHTLLYNPGVIATSSLYSMTHCYPLWEQLTPTRLRAFDIVLFGALAVWLAAGLGVLMQNGAWAAVGLVSGGVGLYLIIVMISAWEREPRPARTRKGSSAPNILLIGSDTLRADRLTGIGYPRDLTPTLDRLALRAARFTSCYVPCARTAPSLASMLTGTWPHTHGVRDTFLTPEQTQLPIQTLPELLEQAGYQTAAVGDWAASDISKLSFRFQRTDVPPDQWNIKYLLRQGPKDMRLFLSLFTQNRLGKTFLPEIYYLGGLPLAEEVGRDTRRMIASLANSDAPFFLTSFMAITHPPFASKYPYYTMFAGKGYRGESKFAMARLRDPFEIIRRQGEPRTEFDLDQIIDLYDGCVKNFDDEVGRILSYLDASGLGDNTIVLIFSDHGFEFFEHETWGQGNSAIGDFSARVPLLIADPRNPQPHLIPDVVRTVDVAPTLLELAGLPIRDYMEGVSLVPLMHGERLRAELPAFYETGVWLTDLPGTPEKHLRYPDLPDLLEVSDKRLGMISLKPKYLDITTVAKDRMVRVGDWKLTYQPLTDGPLYQLFNILEDPECRRNVLEQHPETAERLRKLLLDWMGEDSGNASYRVAGAASAANLIAKEGLFPAKSKIATNLGAAGAPLGAKPADLFAAKAAPTKGGAKL